MRNAIAIGTVAGLIFGVVMVWEGAGAAGLVLLFSLVGLLSGALAIILVRVVTGDVDTAEVRSLFSSVVNGRGSR